MLLEIKKKILLIANEHNLKVILKIEQKKDN